MISLLKWLWIGVILTSVVSGFGFSSQQTSALSRGLSMSRGFPSSGPPSRGRSASSPRGKPGSGKPQGSSMRSSPNSREARGESDKKRYQAFEKSEERVNDDIKLESSERIQKLIARSGIASRRDAEKMITGGRVTVNGKLTKELGTKVDVRKDKVVVDGKMVTMPDNKGIFWIVLNKPKDCLTTLDDDKGRTTIRTLIPKANDLRLVTVGRMDRDNTGLLLLTNEVGWIHPLTHPSYSISKRYELVVEGFVSDAAMKAANDGTVFPLTKRQFPPCTLEVLDVDKANQLTMLEFQANDYTSTLMEELIESMQCKLLSSKRTGFGPLRLKGLKKGEWRELLPTEVVKLKTACKKLPSSVIEKAKLVSRERAEDRAEKQLQRELKYNPERAIPETGRRQYRSIASRGATATSPAPKSIRDRRDRIPSGSNSRSNSRIISRSSGNTSGPRGSPFVSETSKVAPITAPNNRPRFTQPQDGRQRSSRVNRVSSRGGRDNSDPPDFDDRRPGRDGDGRPSSKSRHRSPR